MAQWEEQLSAGKRDCVGARKKKHWFLSEGAARAALPYVSGLFATEKEEYLCEACSKAMNYNVWHHATVKGGKRTKQPISYCSEDAP